ncbi:hypothetical protein SAMN05421664_0765 [Chryseobacterium soldanellicola]|uniref:Uncharacterized protein n=1 Tax=Chryseobacterium soldanellicola TaxID=311333 RepID=A0A1H0YJY6_9FLAO|nr:hypothetical protein SAMN05421664_0765 [Chryseobacterium soldanellicola]
MVYYVEILRLLRTQDDTVKILCKDYNNNN